MESCSDIDVVHQQLASRLEGLSVSAHDRTRKMVNYACEKAKSEETLVEACSDIDVQIVRYTWG